MISFGMAEMDSVDREYSSWVTGITQATERLDVLETAVAELRRLCEREDVHSEDVLELLERHRAISKVARRRSHAA
jgi:DNA repair ATPase RecN